MNAQGLAGTGGLGGFQNLDNVQVSIKTSLWGPRTVTLSVGEQKKSFTFDSLIKNLGQEISKASNDPVRMADLKGFLTNIKTREMATAGITSNREIQFEELEDKINDQLIFTKFMELNGRNFAHKASVSDTTWLESRTVSFNVGEEKITKSFDSLFEILNRKIENASFKDTALLNKLGNSLNRLKSLENGNRNDYGTYRKRDNQIAELELKIKSKQEGPLVYDRIKKLENFDKFMTISFEKLIAGSRSIEFKSSENKGVTSFSELINILSNDIEQLENKFKEGVSIKSDIQIINLTFGRIKDMEEKSRNFASKAISYGNRADQWVNITNRLKELNLG